MDKIIILGFGRSGTTWLSDIISKSLGCLILFEPLHPEVYPDAKEACYETGHNAAMSSSIEKQIATCMAGEITNPWLIRNHLGMHIEKSSPKFIQDIWDECKIGGYKEIRSNLMIPHLHENVSDKIVFIKRNPFSVLASLKKRVRFWEEFGFPYHIDKFKHEISQINHIENFKLNELIQTCDALEEDYLKMMFIWFVTHYVAEHDLKQLNIPVFSYEDLYTDPYAETRKIVSHLGLESQLNIHPSYIFTPSMLTLKTQHEFAQQDLFDKEKNSDVFWRNSLTPGQVDKINALFKTLEEITGYIY